MGELPQFFSRDYELPSGSFPDTKGRPHTGHKHKETSNMLQTESGQAAGVWWSNRNRNRNEEGDDEYNSLWFSNYWQGSLVKWHCHSTKLPGQ